MRVAFSAIRAPFRFGNAKNKIILSKKKKLSATIPSEELIKLPKAAIEGTQHRAKSKVLLKPGFK